MFLLLRSVLGGATISGLPGWGFYAVGASVSVAGFVYTAPGLNKLSFIINIKGM